MIAHRIEARDRVHLCGCLLTGLQRSTGYLTQVDVGVTLLLRVIDGKYTRV